MFFSTNDLSEPIPKRIFTASHQYHILTIYYIVISMLLLHLIKFSVKQIARIVATTSVDSEYTPTHTHTPTQAHVHRPTDEALALVDTTMILRTSIHLYPSHP